MRRSLALVSIVILLISSSSAQATNTNPKDLWETIRVISYDFAFQEDGLLREFESGGYLLEGNWNSTGNEIRFDLVINSEDSSVLEILDLQERFSVNASTGLSNGTYKYVFGEFLSFDENEPLDFMGMVQPLNGTPDSISSNYYMYEEREEIFSLTINGRASQLRSLDVFTPQNTLTFSFEESGHTYEEEIYSNFIVSNDGVMLSHTYTYILTNTSSNDEITSKNLEINAITMRDYPASDDARTFPYATFVFGLIMMYVAYKLYARYKGSSY